MSVGLQAFKIVLDNDQASFLPGETISGKLIIDLGRSKSVRGVKLRFKGKGEVKWSESRGSGKDRRTTWYTAEEEYFRMDLLLLGTTTDGNENVEIASGYHVFPFNFTLPPNVPNTFHHEHGNIDYSIKAIIDRPWKFDHETTLAFTVAAPFDLAQDPTAGLSIDDEEQKSFCCFPCFDMGSMNVHIHIPTSGYAVGDPLRVTIDLNNNSSSVDVTGIKLKFKQIITLHATAKSKKDTRTVQKTEKFGAFSRKDQVTVGLQVPTVPSCNFLHTNLVDINYNIQVVICVSDCHCDMKREYPIIIGERLPPNFGPIAAAYGAPGENSFAVPVVHPIPPSAPFFGSEDPTGLPNKEHGYNGTAPFPLNPVRPAYGFAAANLPQAPSIPGTSGIPPFPYPPAIGFFGSNPSESTSVPANPPPSYDEVVGTQK